MKKTRSLTFENAPRTVEAAPLDIVVPWTTPRLTAAALKAANRLGAGLESVVRIVKVQVVPFPLDLRFSPVPVEFLAAQLTHFGEEFSCLPFSTEIRLAREFEGGLRGGLRSGSLILLATLKRPWRTRSERLARLLRAWGHTVAMVHEDEKNA